MIFIPFVMALAVRWSVAAAHLGAAQAEAALDLAAYYPPLVGYVMLLIVPYFWGAIIGFLCSTSTTSNADRLTGDAAFFAARLFGLSAAGRPALLAALTTLLVMQITGLFDLPWWGYPLLALSVRRWRR
ncbi:MAG: hypothetical protein IPM07_14360 [Anaerolineales bacterium]|nr:hypothetical protein [Anaerolineales bacterium]